MNTLDNLLKTCAIQSGGKTSITQHMIWQFQFIDYLDCQFGNCSVPTWCYCEHYRQVVDVETARGKAYCKATRLCNKHHKYSEQWNPWHPFLSVYDIHWACTFSHQMHMWIDQYQTHWLDNIWIESFQSSDAQWHGLSQLNPALSYTRCNTYHSHIFITLFYRDIFKYSQFLLAHLPLQVHTNVEPVQIVDLEDCRIYGKMTIDNW
jgi:hypothetical protein